MNAAFIATSAAPAAGVPGGAAGEAVGADDTLGAALFTAALGAAVGRRGSDAATVDADEAPAEGEGEGDNEWVPVLEGTPIAVALPVAVPTPAMSWWFGVAPAVPTAEAATAMADPGPLAASTEPGSVTEVASMTTFASVTEVAPRVGEPVQVVTGTTQEGPEARLEALAARSLDEGPAPEIVEATPLPVAPSRVEATPAPDAASPAPLAPGPTPVPVVVRGETPHPPPQSPAPGTGTESPDSRQNLPPVTVKAPATEPVEARAEGTGPERPELPQNLPPVAAKPPMPDAPVPVAERPDVASRDWGLRPIRPHGPLDEARRDAPPAPRAAALLTAVLGRADAALQPPAPFTLPATTATTTTPALAATMDAELPTQLIESIRVLGREGAGEARIRLRPDVLGEVTIAINVTRGAVTAAIDAESPAVRQWVESHEGLLREKLAEHGLQLERLTVSEEDAPRESGQRDRRQSRDEEPDTPPRRQRPTADAPRFEIVL